MVETYAAGLRIPRAFNARSITTLGSRSPVAATLTIAFAISSVMGSSRLATGISDQGVFIRNSHYVYFVGTEGSICNQSINSHGGPPKRRKSYYFIGRALRKIIVRVRLTRWLPATSRVPLKYRIAVRGSLP